jgi:hypothetical protein
MSLLEQELTKMQIKITVTNGLEVPIMLKQLPNKLQEFIMSNSESYMVELRKALRMRMPKETGFMSNRIFVDATQDGFVLTIDTPYAAAQEFGFTPHMIPIEYINQHKTDRTRGSWVSKPKGFVLVSKNTPFVEPSLNATNSLFIQLMNKALTKALGKK